MSRMVIEGTEDRASERRVEMDGEGGAVVARVWVIRPTSIDDVLRRDGLRQGGVLR